MWGITTKEWKISPGYVTIKVSRMIPMIRLGDGLGSR